MNEISSGAGSRGDVTAIDGEAVLAELSRGNFVTSTNAGTYSPEMLTTSYIDGLFTALKNVEDYWKECINYTRNYIENFENIPMPEDFEDDSAFLDETEYSNTVGATLTGVTTSLNIRSSASTDSDKVGSIGAGGEIKEVLGETTDENGKKWYKIKTEDGQEGYVSGDYVKLKETPQEIMPQASDTKTETPSGSTPQTNSGTKADSSSGTTSPSNNSKTQQGNTNQESASDKTSDNIGIVQLNDENSHLNMRSTPDSSSSENIIGQLSNNDELTIIGEENGFYQIKTSAGKIAYVSKDYINVSNNK